MQPSNVSVKALSLERAEDNGARSLLKSRFQYFFRTVQSNESLEKAMWPQRSSRVQEIWNSQTA